MGLSSSPVGCEALSRQSGLSYTAGHSAGVTELFSVGKVPTSGVRNVVSVGE